MKKELYEFLIVIVKKQMLSDKETKPTYLIEQDYAIKLLSNPFKNRDK